MSIIIRPPCPKGTHPIETGIYTLATNEINKLYQKVANWIDNRSPGGIVYSKPRVGKTKAINFLYSALPKVFNAKLPIFSILCREYRYPNENRFFEDVLKDIEHSMISGKPNAKRDRIIRFFIDKTLASEQNKILLFIDEAQRLRDIQYEWLMDIYNELESNGIILTAILVGQYELTNIRETFIRANKRQIIGRFMSQEYKFHGIKNLKDIKTCLQGYDQNSEYPEDSGWSFTKYFFPDVFEEEGFRLENYAEDLFNVFENLRSEANIKKAMNIPMQYITLTIEYILKHYGCDGSNLNQLSRVQWKEAIKNSGYIDAEIFEDLFNDEVSSA